MAAAPVPTPSTSPAPAVIVAVPSDPVSAAAFAAGNLFVFLCTPVGQKISSDAETAGKAIADVVKGLAQDVTNIFRGVHL
ncbi:MAG TPA: hypothetical protein VMG35_10095 [Bryobacteraceae bacterium]|nr:hypothetical protein [Bryobacteraceae bacterium]